MIEVGTVLYFNYGAMHPDFFAKVESISDDGRFALFTDPTTDAKKKMLIADIRDVRDIKVNHGSQIGVFKNVLKV